jgi:hypothetical protein
MDKSIYDILSKEKVKLSLTVQYQKQRTIFCLETIVKTITK